ncbi:MAG: hypothetical protein EOR96_32005 [Mesorhizobium sp.]|nr:MAG: hypothetical protein EOR96_32005 [Mesorhizobium sp.]
MLAQSSCRTAPQPCRSCRTPLQFP